MTSLLHPDRSIPANVPLRTCLALTLCSVAAFNAAPRAASADPIQPTSDVEEVRGDFQFTEGPAWHSDGTLYFSDIPASTIFRLQGDGEFSKLTEESNYANGLLVASDGRLLACEMAGQVVVHDLEAGTRDVLAGNYQGKRFNAPNDLILDNAGGVYFTDPLFRAPEPLPQGVQAVYYVDGSGNVSRITGDLAAPNGIGLSPDGKQLYVIPSRQAEMLVYDVTAPGKIDNGRVFCTLKQPEGRSDTGGDGMAVDVEGNVYITSQLGVQIFAADGSPKGIVGFPEQPANVTFGGSDRKTMYVTARTGLYRVGMPIAGLKPN